MGQSLLYLFCDFYDHSYSEDVIPFSKYNLSFFQKNQQQAMQSLVCAPCCLHEYSVGTRFLYFEAPDLGPVDMMIFLFLSAKIYRYDYGVRVAAPAFSSLSPPSVSNQSVCVCVCVGSVHVCHAALLLRALYSSLRIGTNALVAVLTSLLFCDRCSFQVVVPLTSCTRPCAFSIR